MDAQVVATQFEQMRTVQPLVHQITNWVTIGDCASITRSFGALPVMAHAREEAADMAGIASAVVLNIGTLTPEIVEAMKLAAIRANERGIPVVLDAVGVGATPLRDQKAAELLGTARIDIIKGNISEIARLAGEDVVTRGVEATDVAVQAATVAKRLASARNAVAVVTGAVDTVSDGETVYHIHNGDPLMGAVVGTGCMAAPIIGAFAASGDDLAQSAAAALACYGIAGELAAAKSEGPGSFKGAFFDAAYSLTSETVAKKVRIDED